MATPDNTAGGETVSEDKLRVAVIVVSEFIVIVHVPVPEQPPPDQPAKAEPLAGLAVRVMLVPGLTVSAQSDPQLIPAPVTVPEPVPDLETVRV